MKIIRVKNNLTVILEDGTRLSSTNCDDDMYNEIIENEDNEDFVKKLMLPNFSEKKEEAESKIDMINNYNKSEYLTVEDNKVYIKSISNLSLPEDLSLAIWNAEQIDDIELLSTYLNFWTLASLNPDSEARINLFWFLKKYGMTISRSGLFVTYRNAVLKEEGTTIDSEWVKFITDSFTKIKFKQKQSPKKYYIGLNEEGEKICVKSEDKLTEVKGILNDLYESLSDTETGPIYTDQHSKSFTIRIGQPVTMKRSKCDPDPTRTCSRGLHVAGKSWLKGGYFGNTGLRCLVNPADVVAVPPLDHYGKMRCCAYYPVAVVEYGEDGQIIDEKIKDGFEDNFIDIISYVGEVNQDDENAYIIDIPEIPELSKNRIMDRLADIKAILKIKYTEKDD